nr:leucine-rich repeat extensin-like protein 5 [Aedes albopictus]
MKMNVKLHVRELLAMLMMLMDQSLSRTIEISAYGNGSSYGYSSLRNGASQSPTIGRAMSGAGYRNSFDEMLRKPVSGYQDPLKMPKYVVYPSNSQSIDYGGSSKDVAMDRFAPGEAYGGTVYKIIKARENKGKYGYQYQKPNAAPFDDGKTNAPSTASPPAPVVPPSITPPPLPVFIAGPTPNPPTSAPATAAPAPVAPPNTSPDSSPSNQYIPPSFNGFSSYLPPPSGTPDDAPSVDSGPQPVSSADAVLPAPPIPSSPPPSNQYIPPDSLFQFPPNIHSHYHPPPPTDAFQLNGISSYLPPPAGPSNISDSGDTIGTISVGPDTPYSAYLPPSQPATPAPMTMQQMPMDMMPPSNNMMMMMGMPPAPMATYEMGRHPPMDFDFHGYYPHDHFPEYIFDHDHDHDHFHDETTTTTTPAPPPPEPPKRVKNYSYYYVTRFFWYIPLYFSLYMLFYVLVLILRFVARKKANYPNQWTGRLLGDMQIFNERPGS